MSETEIIVSGLPVICVAIAEFDILVGNTLSTIYPKISLLDHYKERKLADLCLPDGGHLYSEDNTLIVLPPPPKEVLKETEDAPLYGMVYFRNKSDPTVKRGAIQKSIVLFTFKPLFTVFEPLMKLALSRVLDKGEKADKVLKTFYTSLTDEGIKKELSINLWNEKILIRMPKLQEDQFVGVSLIDLVTRFKKDTMLIWNALLTGKRIMFVGTPAKQVLNCCLSCPLLVQPLVGFSKNIHPYVALTDLDPIMSKAAICGTTNLLFESKPDVWWDVCASFASGNVISKHKADKNDRVHIYNVLGGIKDGKPESWVREQFSNYTIKFIHSVLGDTASKKVAEQFKATPYFESFIKNMGKEIKKVSLKDVLEDLKKGDSLPVLERVKKMFELKTMTEDLSNVDELCNIEGGVEIVAKCLTDQNSQYRKYSTSVLANLASSVKGQLAILSGDILPMILSLLADEMPNVRTGAAYCIMKISELYVGVKALLKYKIIEKWEFEPTILGIKMSYIQTFYNIYRYAPKTKKPDTKAIIEDLHKSANPQYNNQVLLFLDLLREDLKDVVKVSPKIKKAVTALSDPEVVAEILLDLQQNSASVFEYIQAGIISFIIKDMKKGKFVSQLGVQILVYISDTNYGVQALAHENVIKFATKLLATCRPDLYHLTLLQFFDCCCQYDVGANVFLESGGVNYLIKIISKHYYSALTSSLCLKSLKCLHNLLRTLSEKRSTIAKSLEALETLPVSKPKEFGSLVDGFEEFEGERTKKFISSFESLGVRNVLNEMLEKTLKLAGKKLVLE